MANLVVFTVLFGVLVLHALCAPAPVPPPLPNCGLIPNNNNNVISLKLPNSSTRVIVKADAAASTWILLPDANVVYFRRGPSGAPKPLDTTTSKLLNDAFQLQTATQVSLSNATVMIAIPSIVDPETNTTVLLGFDANSKPTWKLPLTNPFATATFGPDSGLYPGRGVFSNDGTTYVHVWSVYTPQGVRNPSMQWQQFFTIVDAQDGVVLNEFSTPFQPYQPELFPSDSLDADEVHLSDSGDYLSLMYLSPKSDSTYVVDLSNMVLRYGPLYSKDRRYRLYINNQNSIDSLVEISYKDSTLTLYTFVNETDRNGYFSKFAWKAPSPCGLSDSPILVGLGLDYFVTVCVNDYSPDLNFGGANPSIYSIDSTSGELASTWTFNAPSFGSVPYQIDWDESMSGNLFGFSLNSPDATSCSCNPSILAFDASDVTSPILEIDDTFGDPTTCKFTATYDQVAVLQSQNLRQVSLTRVNTDGMSNIMLFTVNL